MPQRARMASIRAITASRGPQDEIFSGPQINPQIHLVGDTVSSTLDFRFDLLVGVIVGSDFDIIVKGAQIFTGGSVTDTVINLGSNFGPNIDLTIDGFGTFAFGGVVPETAIPEPTPWAMMLVGFAGIGFAGYRRVRQPRGA
jgi:hypothetical protein